jgi:hypothetical protein
MMMPTTEMGLGEIKSQARGHTLKTRGGGWEVAQTMYTHVSKCNNDKVKGEKNTEKDRIRTQSV